MKQKWKERKGLTISPGGLSGWLLGKLRSTERQAPRLALLERIALAPRQSLALVEAEGRRFLVATSAEGSPAFYALDAKAGHSAARRSPRISW
jgi:flagellar biogenesis protein FliO